MTLRGEGGDVEDLPCRFSPSERLTISVWQFTFDERQAILDGARVVLSVLGAHPPLSLQVEGVNGAGRSSAEPGVEADDG